MNPHQVYEHVQQMSEYPRLLIYGSGVGFVLWVFVLGLIIYHGWRNKIAGMPLLGISTTLTQCFIYSFVGPWREPGLFVHNQYSSTFAIVWVWRVWFVLQAVVLVQYLLYHRNAPSEFNVPAMESRPFVFAAGLLVLNLVGQWTFVTFYHDSDLNQSDPFTYMLLSMSWVLLALARPGAEGLDRSVAWMKAIGTTLIFTCTLSNPARSFGALTVVQRNANAAYQALELFRGVRPEPQSILERRQALATLGFSIIDGDPPTRISRPDVGVVELIGGTATRPMWQFANAAAMDVLRKHPVGARGLADAQAELESIGFETAGTDMIYRSDVGYIDVVPNTEEGGSYWQWLHAPATQLVVLESVYIRYEFPLFMIVAGVFFDWVYVYVVTTKRRRALGPTPAAAA